jgi:hypothetical protein
MPIQRRTSAMEPIAIIGMSFRFPGGAESSEDFWQMLVGKKCAAAKVPRDRFNVDAFWNPDVKKQNTVSGKSRNFLCISTLTSADQYKGRSLSPGRHQELRRWLLFYGAT